MKTSKTKKPKLTSPGERFKPIQPEDRYIIDLTDAEIEDLNDALKEEEMDDIKFGTNRGIDPIAYYTLGTSNARNRIAPATKLSEIWKLARSYFPKDELP